MPFAQSPQLVSNRARQDANPGSPRAYVCHRQWQRGSESTCGLYGEVWQCLENVHDGEGTMHEKRHGAGICSDQNHFLRT
jgi:hypothetical protein